MFFQALVRDQCRCLLTGVLDIDVAVAFPGRHIPDAHATITEAAYIFPEPSNTGISTTDENDPELNYAASVWAVMARFGNNLAFDDLNGSTIHRLENVMTLSIDIHRYFDNLQLWLESTDTPHTYRPNSVNLIYRGRIPPTVTFTTHDPVNFPLPSPEYLRLHAAAARVAHLSGAGEYINKILRDVEETRVLSTDGSSAELLAAALRGISVQ
ncbi:hypothetical protein BJ138DRAFT_1017041 [Hygrophoropsis aurantiaca]|uniref:Uncharacterized protein n=1 Tax=Hygrophoropsis aurantiaca TaxID=72124 RepID=A0ACB7ZYF0_9AGAM|nr:hypothetical protein BJ138DRAFT_1017041 [Hygrophoropsis aurantiaca]